MNDKRVEKDLTSAFGLGCAVITAGALFLAIAIGIFAGIAFGFLAFAGYCVALGAFFALAAIYTAAQKKKQNTTSEGEINDDRN